MIFFLRLIISIKSLIIYVKSLSKQTLWCPHVLAIVSNAVMNVGVRVPLYDTDFISLIFKGTSILFSIMDVAIYILTNIVQGTLFATSSSRFVISCPFDKTF